MKNKIEIHKVDITKLEVDTIVYAANISLLGGAVSMVQSTGLQDRNYWKNAIP